MQMHVSKRNHYLGWLKSGDGDTDKDWNRSLIFKDMLQWGRLQFSWLLVVFEYKGFT